MKRLAETIETDRLIGKKISKDDLDDLVKIYSDTQLMKMVGSKRDYKETIEATKKSMLHWEERGFGFWIFRDKENRRFIGKAGFEVPENKDLNDLQIDFIVVGKYWKQGYATEMVKACLDVALNKLNLENISSIALADNFLAHKVMEKAGLRYEKDIIDENNHYVLYKMVKELA